MRKPTETRFARGDFVRTVFDSYDPHVYEVDEVHIDKWIALRGWRITYTIKRTKDDGSVIRLSGHTKNTLLREYRHKPRGGGLRWL